MPPPIPLSGAAAWYSAGSQSGSASSSANRGLRVSQACSGDEAAAIVAWTSATNTRTTSVPRTNSSLIAADSDPTRLQIGRRTVRLTHPERVLFPDDGVTKGHLAQYYSEIGDVIVPHLRDRPFTLKRYPHGIHGQPYFHKQAPKGEALVEPHTAGSDLAT